MDSTVTNMTTGCELRAGPLRLALRPDLGGCIAGLWHGDAPVLRCTPPAALESSRDSGSYPLVPYSNRLAYRRFRWKGQDYATLPNFDDNPHSLHGVGWRRAWRVASATPAEAELQLEHVPDGDWPFAFEVRQRFTLAPESLRIAMVFTNHADIAQPVGLGWHPYFPKRARSRLHVECEARWDPDPFELPVRRVAQPGIDGDVQHMAFDHCFDGWRGPARIRDERFSLQLSSSLDRLVVFTPQQREYFCVEPVSHVSNAIHMADPHAHGLRSVAPGEVFEAWMRLDVQGV
jgi:aldose 1-epimerase